MFGSQAKDQSISQQVTQKLATRGLRQPCQVSVQTKNGDVTLSGTVQYAHQKTAAGDTANRISGVRRVINQLTVKTVVKG